MDPLDVILQTLWVLMLVPAIGLFIVGLCGIIVGLVLAGSPTDRRNSRSSF